MNSSTKIALVITLLDAMGIGLIMPVLPTLLREFIASEDIANHFGVLLALYALMQVIFAPWLGKMSDRFGRRPVLLLSLIGASLDYLLLAFSSALWMLYLGRLLSGITGATGAVAASVIADTTSASQRVKWFGWLGASFGLGLIAGPIIGGFAGEISPHSPFFIAALLNIVAFLVVMFWFRETKNTRDNTDTEVGVETQSNSVYITLFKTGKTNQPSDINAKKANALLSAINPSSTAVFSPHLVAILPATKAWNTECKRPRPANEKPTIMLFHPKRFSVNSTHTVAGIWPINCAEK